ncbi:MAG: acyltransferase [Bacteroidota bacterium]
MTDIRPQSASISAFNSLKFRFWSFIAMFLLVFVHGYNLNENYLQPWTIPGEPMTFTAFTEYFLANGIFRFRIPMLFIISGYLFALHDYRPYGQRTRKRLRTLFIPYIIWSSVGLAFTWLLELHPFTRDIVAGSHIVQIDGSRLLLHDYHWYELAARWILIPVPYQLWFIRVLLIYNIAYPAIRWCIQHHSGQWIFFGLAFLMWLSTAGFVFFEGEGLLFFSLGVWMQKKNFDIDKPNPMLNPLWWGIAFVMLSVLKTWLAFNGEPLLGNSVYPLLTIMHKLVIVGGLISAWYGGNGIVEFFMKKPWFVWLSAFSFIIYAFHAPLVAYATKAVFNEVHEMVAYRMLTFILLPLTIIAVAVGFGALLRRFLPGLYGVLTGGRGF